MSCWRQGEVWSLYALLKVMAMTAPFPAVEEKIKVRLIEAGKLNGSPGSWIERFHRSSARFVTGSWNAPTEGAENARGQMASGALGSKWSLPTHGVPA